jgi:copper resistance protein C
MRPIANVVILSILICMCAWTMAAWGHAFPDHSDPRVGSTISDSPPQARIWFDSELEGEFSEIRVENSESKRIDKGDGHVDKSDAKLLEVDLPPLPAGVYRVTWTAVSRDGHRTEGSYTFTVK